jgi:hypothetical protein
LSSPTCALEPTYGRDQSSMFLKIRKDEGVLAKNWQPNNTETLVEATRNCDGSREAIALVQSQPRPETNVF